MWMLKLMEHAAREFEELAVGAVVALIVVKMKMQRMLWMICGPFEVFVEDCSIVSAVVVDWIATQQLWMFRWVELTDWQY